MLESSVAVRFSSDSLRQAAVRIAETVRNAGGRALLVGGCVRDALLGSDAKDVDIEVYGLPPECLTKTLAESFDIDLVGQAFGVIKVKRLPIDVSIPRRESKAGLGHKGFDVRSDPGMQIEDAASRRDFTVNAMALDLLSGELFDPFGGLSDLRDGVLRHTSDKFDEDPLRVLRAMQFASRFDFRVAPETVNRCRGIEPEGLAIERIFDEWKKLIIKGRKPSRGLGFLRDCNWIRHYPELEALVRCGQDPQWHPEGDVWTHTLHVMDAFALEKAGDEWEDLVVGLACLCHDFGKPATTTLEEGHICAHGHEEAGEGPTRSFLGRMTNQTDLINQIVPLVTDHLKPLTLFECGVGKPAIRRLALRVGRIDRLVRVARADQQGRPPKSFNGFPQGEWLLERARSLAVENERPKPIVTGRHLIRLGLTPGEHFGPILQDCFEAQLDGIFATEEDGISFARTIIERRAWAAEQTYERRSL